jgi:methylphosphotriester-DNA--protein-cysteine methyltransferase
MDWRELIDATSAAPPSTVALIDPFDAGDEVRVSPHVQELLSVTRILPVVARVPLVPKYTAAVRELLALGVAEIADADFETTAGGLRARLLAAHAKPLKNLVEPALSRFVSENALTLIRGAIETAVDRGSALDLASLFGSADRTVTGWCHREGLPPPRRLLAWMRVLLALALLREPRRSVLNAAVSAGYGTEHALRRVLREFLGGDAQPRERSLDQVLATLNAELRALRESRRPRRHGMAAAW